jgi:hypothetical protein
MDIQVLSEIIEEITHPGQLGRAGRISSECILEIGFEDIFISLCSELGAVAA